jgi:hypothetical protein
MPCGFNSDFSPSLRYQCHNYWPSPHFPYPGAAITLWSYQSSFGWMIKKTLEYVGNFN